MRTHLCISLNSEVTNKDIPGRQLWEVVYLFIIKNNGSFLSDAIVAQGIWADFQFEVDIAFFGML